MSFPDDEKPIHEPLTDNKNVAGITVVTILGIMVFVVIALICYAQKNTVSLTKYYIWTYLVLKVISEYERLISPLINQNFRLIRRALLLKILLSNIMHAIDTSEFEK